MEYQIKLETADKASQIMLDSDESVRMDANEYRIDRVHKVFYRLIRNVIIFFIGFGAPLHHWLSPNDVFRQYLERHQKLWLYYRIYCWLLLHICLVMNFSSLIYLCVWIHKDVSELCQQIVQLIWSLSAVVTLDSSYYYRKSTLLEATCEKTTDTLKDCKHKMDTKSADRFLLYDIKIPLHLNFIKHFYKIYSIPRLNKFVKLFLFPIVFNLYFYVELVVNFRRLSVEKILNLFMFMNIFIVTVNILIYLAFCIVFSNKFRHLNQYIKSLIETKNTTIDQLYVIAKWYKHNCSKVNKFDQTFNLFIVTFYLSIAFNIIVSIFGIILHSRVEALYKNILVYNIFYYTFIACNTLLFIIFSYIGFKAASDVNVVSDKTKKLIEKYVTCSDYDSRNIDFNVEYQHFNTTIFSKPVNLTLFGFGSITRVSLGLGLISCLPYIPDIIEFSLEHRFPIDQKDLTNYFQAFVNETMESLEDND